MKIQTIAARLSLVAAAILAVQPLFAEPGAQAGAASQAGKPDYCALEKEQVAASVKMTLVMVGESESPRFAMRVEISARDAARIRELLLTRTRYAKPLEGTRDDYWQNIDDGVPEDMVELLLYAEQGECLLGFILDMELISADREKEGRLHEFGPLVMSSDAYREMLEILRSYVPQEQRGLFGRLAGVPRP